MTLRIRRWGEVPWAAGFLVIGSWQAASGRSVEGSVLAFAWAARCAWFATRERPPEPEDALGAGPLAPSGTGRFKASGWPPSKDPSDYR